MMAICFLIHQHEILKKFNGGTEMIRSIFDAQIQSRTLCRLCSMPCTKSRSIQFDHVLHKHQLDEESIPFKQVGKRKTVYSAPTILSHTPTYMTFNTGKQGSFP